MAIATPLLLLIIVGGLGLGLLLLHRIELQHAADEAVTAVAIDGDCDGVNGTLQQLLHYQPQEIDCETTGPLAELRLAHTWPALLPGLPERIVVAGRAIMRTTP